MELTIEFKNNQSLKISHDLIAEFDYQKPTTGLIIPQPITLILTKSGYAKLLTQTPLAKHLVEGFDIETIVVQDGGVSDVLVMPYGNEEINSYQHVDYIFPYQQLRIVIDPYFVAKNDVNLPDVMICQFEDGRYFKVGSKLLSELALVSDEQATIEQTGDFQTICGHLIYGRLLLNNHYKQKKAYVPLGNHKNISELLRHFVSQPIVCFALRYDDLANLQFKYDCQLVMKSQGARGIELWQQN